MSYPITAEKDGIKIKPEIMEVEKLYHCIYDNKIMLVFKDNMEILNCYEIEEKTLVEKIQSCKNSDDVEKMFQEYIEKENIKN